MSNEEEYYKSENEVKPKDIKYMAIPEFNSNGTVDADNPEGWKCARDLYPLVSKIKDDIEEHGGTTFIYEMRLIKKVVRPHAKVIDLIGGK